MNDTDLATLRAYLAERDVPCPGCGYNLRGAQEALCPECGGAVTLGIGRRYLGVWALLLAILAWASVGAGLDAARAGRSAFDQSRSFQSQFLSFGGTTTFRVNTSITAGSIVLNRSATGGGTSITVPSGPASGSAPAIRTAPGGGVTIMPAPGGRTRILSGGSSGPATARIWSQVSWQTWTALGGWGLLSLAGLCVVVLVVARRRRLVQDGPGRRLIAAAVALAAIHVSAHILLFVRELVA